MLPFPQFWSKQNRDDLLLGKIKSRVLAAYRLPHNDRRKHFYICGRSGTGKSKILEHCLFEDIAQGRGTGCIDPHSQLIDDLLRLLITKGVLTDPAIQDKLIYVDPTRDDFVIPFNVLRSPDTPYDTAASILEAFRRTWPESLREAPHFSNVVTAALIVLIENKLTLMDMHRLLTNQEFREQCLTHVTEHTVIEFFHDRYDRWGKEAPVMRESTLNKIGAFSLNPRLRLMLGQSQNSLDFAHIMDEQKILLLNLGNADGETNKLIGNLVTTGFERAMRRRKNRKLFPLTIDEFGGYVANDGSEKTFAHILSEARKFALGLCISHQDLSQLSPRMLGALNNVHTKVIFGVGRHDAEYFAKIIGYVDSEAVKRNPKTENQHEMFSSLPEQWEKWVDELRFQPARQATVASADGQVETIKTFTIPPYQATHEDVERVKTECLARYGLPYAEAVNNVGNGVAATNEQIQPVPGIKVKYAW